MSARGGLAGAGDRGALKGEIDRGEMDARGDVGRRGGLAITEFPFCARGDLGVCAPFGGDSSGDPNRSVNSSSSKVSLAKILSIISNASCTSCPSSESGLSEMVGILEELERDKLGLLFLLESVDKGCACLLFSCGGVGMGRPAFRPSVEGETCFSDFESLALGSRRAIRGDCGCRGLSRSLVMMESESKAARAVLLVMDRERGPCSYTPSIMKQETGHGPQNSPLQFHSEPALRDWTPSLSSIPGAL